MPRSMTGFARVQTESGHFALTLSVKSVNHRFLDVQMRLPAELEPFEVAARRSIRQRIARGHLQVNAQLEIRAPLAPRIQRPMVDAYLAAYRQLAREHRISAEPDLNAVLRLPGTVAWDSPAGGPLDGLEASLLAALDQALQQLEQSRQREAVAMVDEMQHRSEAIDASLDRIAHLREGLTARLAGRLAQKLSEVLKMAALDPQRILQEAALLVERTDIREEIERLRQHNRQLRELLAAPGEVGKRLDFLLQEMNREANTTLSKTSGIGEAGIEITDLGLALKAEIEAIREQAMNLE